MAKRLACAAALLLLTLVLGATEAGGRALAVSNLTVQVIGKGTVTSDPAGLGCGNGSTICYLAFSGSGSTTLTATPASGWSFDSWSNCPSPSGSQCSVPVDGTNTEVTANFTGPPTTTSTLSVTTSGDGTVAGGDISCGSATTDTACAVTTLTGSTLTLVQTPDPGQVFTAWGGACTGAGPVCTVLLSGSSSVSATWVSSTGVLLTVSISGSGSVTGGGINCPSTCSGTEAVDSTVVLTATPASGQIFSGWGPAGACSGTATTCAVTMSEAQEVSATFAPVFALDVSVNGNGNVSGVGGAINCGNGAGVCSATFALNLSVTLLAVPATGATFLGWSGACGGTSTTCTVLMSAAKSVTATFLGGTGASSTLTVSASGPGTVSGGGINCSNGSGTCSVNVVTGSSVTLTETPSAGATFSGWGGACFGTTPTCTVSMTVAKSVTASFSSGTSSVPVSVSVSGRGKVSGGPINCGNGALACSASLAPGTSLTLVATPASGASFVRWGGACTGSVKQCTLKVSVPTSVSATFSGATPAGTLTINVSGKGSVSTSAGKCTGSGARKTCVQKLGAGKTVVLKAVPAAGSRFGGWSGSCTGSKATCTLTLSTGMEVTATFVSAAPSGLEPLGTPVVKRSGSRFSVTLHFSTRHAGTARVTAIRAGRSVMVLPLHVAAGQVTVGPFALARAGLYTLKVRLGAESVSWRVCLGGCFAKAPAPDFVLSGELPDSTRSGDVWSLTLRLRANLISVGNVRVLRGGKTLVRRRMLAPSGRFALGPFLFGPGSYTVRFSATDAFGRIQTLSWVVALAR